MNILCIMNNGFNTNNSFGNSGFNANNSFGNTHIRMNNQSTDVIPFYYFGWAIVESKRYFEIFDSMFPN